MATVDVKGLKKLGAFSAVNYLILLAFKPAVQQSGDNPYNDASSRPHSQSRGHYHHRGWSCLQQQSQQPGVNDQITSTLARITHALSVHSATTRAIMTLDP